MTSPSEDETPPPIVEQKSTPQTEKKPAEDTDSKDKKAAKKKKQKDDKSNLVDTSREAKKDDASLKKSDVKKKAEDSKSKKAEKKKSEKSDEKTAAEKDADTKKTDKSADNDADKKPGGENAPATILDGSKKAKSTVPLPTRLASFTCGAVLGYPVAFAKRTVHQTKAGNRDFIGESRNPIAIGIATMVSLPFGFVGGMFEGVEYTVANSWKGSGEEPFGKESFSLGDD